MAKNYTISEAVEIIAKGNDLEAIADMSKRYPILVFKVAKVANKAGDDFVDLMKFMPEYLTTNKINSAIKSAMQGGEEETKEEDFEGEVESSESEAEPKNENETTVTWDEKMSAKQLWDILGKAGKRKLAKSYKKSDLIDACKQAFGSVEPEAVSPKTIEEVPEVPEVPEVEEEANESGNPYEGKTAMELFKECKARKIKVAPKKPAKYYVDALIQDDEEKAKAEEATEEEATEEAKPEVPEEKAEENKPDPDDDDDWDI